MRAAAVALAVLLLGAAASRAADFELGTLAVRQPWARASIGQAKAGAAYLTIVNSGDEPDRLIAAATPVAERAQLHTQRVEDGVMKMRPVEAVEIAPGEPAVLAPGGLHIMLMGLTRPLVEGESFALTLSFETAGPLTVEVAVQSPMAMEPSGEPGG